MTGARRSPARHARRWLVVVAALAGFSVSIYPEFLGSGSPVSFSVCEQEVDGAGLPRPECKGSDVRFDLEAGDPNYSGDSDFGFAIATGHLNGDSLVDLVVGDPKRNRVYVFFGRVSPGRAYGLAPDDLSDRRASPEDQADVILLRAPPFPGQVGSFGFSVAVSREFTTGGCPPGNVSSALLIGAPGFPGTTSNPPGTAFYVPAGRLCMAPSDPPVPVAIDPAEIGESFQAPGAAADDEFGYSVAFGRLLTTTATEEDVIVGARGAVSGAGSVTAFPVSGGSVVRGAGSQVRIEGKAGDGLGEVLAVGDLDQDFNASLVPFGGVDDLAIGAVGHEKGKVLLVQGPLSPAGGRDGDGIYREGVDPQIHSILGEARGDFFGFSVAISSQGDLAVGAVLADNTPPAGGGTGGDPLTNVATGQRINGGKAYRWNPRAFDSTSLDTRANTANLVLIARRSGDQLGFVTAFGDLDGSGKDDFIVTARREDGSGLKINEIDQGTAYVIYDSTSLRSPVDLNRCAISSDCTGVSGIDVMIFGGDRSMSQGDEMGFSLATGNLNGDSSDDLFLSSLTQDRVYAVTLEDTDADRAMEGRNIRDEDDDDDGDPDTTDCAPLNASISSTATEVRCNGVDENCNGMADDAPDADGDTFDVCAAAAQGDLDDKPADCNDADPMTHPGATELCDGNNNACTGAVRTDETDADGDGYVGCSGWADTQGDNPGIIGGDDCDTRDPDTFPGAAPKEANPAACMRDKDRDDFGDNTPPAGVTAGIDCDDDSSTGASTFPGSAPREGSPAACMRDQDGDDFGDRAPPAGVTAGTDCADTDPTSHPGSPEVCDGNDNACSGAVPTDETDPDADGYVTCGGWTDPQGDNAAIIGGGDCDPADGGTFPGAAPNEVFFAACMRDKDGDDFGDLTPPAGVTRGTDCDDSSAGAASTFPGAAQIEGPLNCMKDSDDDGYGDGAVALPVVSGTDCDDDSATIFLGATEIPNDGIDQDCNGADLLTCFADNDADGYGRTSPLLADDGDCTDPGESPFDTDCNDNDGTIFPGAPEITGDGIDQDCNGADAITCILDADRDGFGTVLGTTTTALDGTCDPAQQESTSALDCDDNDPNSRPGAIEACDGNDNDCSGVVPADETDPDGDTYVRCGGWADTQGDNPGIVGGGDCDAADADTFPGAAPNEVVSSACMRDKDGDNFGDLTPPAGVTRGTDCDDDSASAASTFPGAAEIDGPLNCMKDGDGDGYGDNSVALPVVRGTDCADSDANTHPGATELCDGNANTCAGAVPADETDLDGDAYVACAAWADTQGDNPGIAGGGDCDAADADTFPGAAPNETFSTECMRDRDGDGFGDLTPPVGVTAGTDCDDDSPGAATTFPGAAEIEAPLNCMKDTDADGYGDASVTLPVVAGTDCDDADAARFPGAPEVCGDMVDSNCDGADPICFTSQSGIQIQISALDATTQTWTPRSDPTSVFCVYRGDLQTLRTTGIYTQEPGTAPGAERFCGLTEPSLYDPFVPELATPVFYLVTERTAAGESTLGADSRGLERPNTNPCP